jgi:NitT/TauT family transport system ATP-binding protein
MYSPLNSFPLFQKGYPGGELRWGRVFPAPTFMSEHGARISFRAVSLTYYSTRSRTQAIERLSFDVAPGTFVAVVGPSGCGKTTLLKLVAGLLHPTEGEVFVDEEKVTRPLKIVGMAFQNASLLPWRTALGNVLLPLEIVQPYARQLRQHKADFVRRAQELLSIVGLAGFENHYAWQLSGGMQQRVSLCRALIHGPKILLLDEPFGALDAFTREELWLVLQKVWLDLGPTVLLVTHDLREAVFLATTVYVMSSRPGRIVGEKAVQFGYPRELELSYSAQFTELVHELRVSMAREQRERA